MPIKVMRDTFKAVNDDKANGSKDFTVTGCVEATSGGWAIKLESDLPGINPDIKIVKIVAVEPPVGTAVMQMHNLCYDEEPRLRDYTHCTIRYGEDEFTIDVRTMTCTAPA